MNNEFDKVKLNRINELAKKHKGEGLTHDEHKEREEFKENKLFF